MIYAMASAAQDWLREKARGALLSPRARRPAARARPPEWPRAPQAAAAGLSRVEVDPLAARKAAEEAEERRLADVRAHGTPVTPATFAQWKARFDGEMAAARARRAEGGERRDAGPTGKAFFRQMDEVRAAPGPPAALPRRARASRRRRAGRPGHGRRGGRAVRAGQRGGGGGGGGGGRAGRRRRCAPARSRPGRCGALRPGADAAPRPQARTRRPTCWTPTWRRRAGGSGGAVGGARAAPARRGHAICSGAAATLALFCYKPCAHMLSFMGKAAPR